jgi:hypothetical protein
MVWLSGWRGNGVRPIVLHDPPPGYRPPGPKVPAKEQRRRIARDRVLIRVAAVILLITAVAFLVLMVVLILTHK